MPVAVDAISSTRVSTVIATLAQPVPVTRRMG